MSITHWLPPTSKQDDSSSSNEPLALCLGTGRFLRSVLAPALVGAGMETIFIQTRGRSFMEYMDSSNSTTYEVDTVQPDGSIVTEHIPCGGAFSLGNDSDRKAALTWISKQHNRCISILGVGVTEAGLTSKDTNVMRDLYEILELLQRINQPVTPDTKLCIINTDNVPNNGTVIESYMKDIAQCKKDTKMESYLSTKIVFLNSMVDRITSQREGSNGLVPKCEPIPAKALVLLDAEENLPSRMKSQPGVVVRTTSTQLQTDIALKLRIANGTHTAIAHTLALLQHYQTDVLSNDVTSGGPLFMKYLDSLVKQQIIPAATSSPTISTSEKDAIAVWDDWRKRLLHPHFGLSTFFITQNGSAKGGIRLGPTVQDLFSTNQEPTAAIAFAYAALLRWLTPLPLGGGNEVEYSIDDTLTGWLDGFDPNVVVRKTGKNPSSDIVEYADGLRYCAKDGWYEYKCSEFGFGVPFTVMLRNCIDERPNQCVMAIRTYLGSSTGGNADVVDKEAEFETFVHAVACFYSRMVSTKTKKGSKVLLDLLLELENNAVGGLIGFDTPCSAMMDHYMYLSGF